MRAVRGLPPEAKVPGSREPSKPPALFGCQNRIMSKADDRDSDAVRRSRAARQRDADAAARDAAASEREAAGDFTGAAADRDAAEGDRIAAAIDREKSARDSDAYDDL